MAWNQKKISKNQDGLHKRTGKIAHAVYVNRIRLSKPGDALTDWEIAEKIDRNLLRKLLFVSNQCVLELRGIARRVTKFIAWNVPRWFLYKLPQFEWTKLIAVPLVLGAAGSIISSQIQREANQISALNQYFDQLERLTFEHSLLSDNPKSGAIVIARGRTISALRGLDIERKQQLLAFLQASGFLKSNDSIKEPIISFKAANLTEIDLHDTQLSEANFVNANLEGANLEGTNLIRANLREAYLVRANLQGAFLFGVDLRGAILGKADLRKAYLGGANLWDVNLAGADLAGANLRKANLRGANLTGADLAGAYLNEVSLRRANLTGANLTGTDLTGVNLEEAELEKVDLRGANLTGANLTGTDLRGANLTGANLTGANLTGTDLTGVDLREANLRGASLGEVYLRGANLERANLGDADLTKAGGITQQQISQALLCQTLLPNELNLDSDRDCAQIGTGFNEEDLIDALRDAYPDELP